MGSASNYSSLEGYEKQYGEKQLEKYRELLLGKRVVNFDEIEIGHFVATNIYLNDGTEHRVHDRWSSELEQSLDREIPDVYMEAYEDEEEEDITYDDLEHIKASNYPDDISFMENYYNKNVKGYKIIDVEIGHSRDDVTYIYGILDSSTKETTYSVQIPIYYVESDDELDENGDVVEKNTK